MLVKPEDVLGNTWHTGCTDLGDGSLFEILKIPPALRDLMNFVEAKFAPRKGWIPSLASRESMANPGNWILTLPCTVPGKRVEIPLPAEIDKDDPEGHWRAILQAAADFRYLVISGDCAVD